MSADKATAGGMPASAKSADIRGIEPWSCNGENRGASWPDPRIAQEGHGALAVAPQSVGKAGSHEPEPTLRSDRIGGAEPDQPRTMGAEMHTGDLDNPTLTPNQKGGKLSGILRRAGLKCPAHLDRVVSKGARLELATRKRRFDTVPDQQFKGEDRCLLFLMK
jgi:hypothetical protein